MTILLRRLRRTGRNYTAAVLLNLALLDTVLTPPGRAMTAQVRIMPAARRFRDSELLTLPDGEVAVLSTPLDLPRARPAVSDN